MNTLFNVIKASFVCGYLILAPGCDVFIPNGEVGEVYNECFGDGSCSSGNSCIREVDMCGTSCESAMNSLYEDNRCWWSEMGKWDAIRHCKEHYSEVSQCGCLIEFTEYMECLSKSDFTYSDCSTTCYQEWKRADSCVERYCSSS